MQVCILSIYECVCVCVHIYLFTHDLTPNNATRSTARRDVSASIYFHPIASTNQPADQPTNNLLICRTTFRRVFIFTEKYLRDSVCFNFGQIISLWLGAGRPWRFGKDYENWNGSREWWSAIKEQVVVR